VVRCAPCRRAVIPHRLPLVGLHVWSPGDDDDDEAEGPKAPADGIARAHHKVSEEQEDDELVQAALTSRATIRLLQQPSIVVGGTMRDYQLEGLNWMINLHDNGINGILADEMGARRRTDFIYFYLFPLGVFVRPPLLSVFSFLHITSTCVYMCVYVSPFDVALQASARPCSPFPCSPSCVSPATSRALTW
jgi:hypothetical protein